MSSGGSVELPEVLVAPDIEGAAADGGRAEDGFLEVDRTDDLAFLATCVDDLAETLFVEVVDVGRGGDRGAAEGAFEAELPLGLSLG